MYVIIVRQTLSAIATDDSKKKINKTLLNVTPKAIHAASAFCTNHPTKDTNNGYKSRK